MARLDGFVDLNELMQTRDFESLRPQIKRGESCSVGMPHNVIERQAKKLARFSFTHEQFDRCFQKILLRRY